MRRETGIQNPKHRGKGKEMRGTEREGERNEGYTTNVREGERKEEDAERTREGLSEEQQAYRNGNIEEKLKEMSVAGKGR